MINKLILVLIPFLLLGNSIFAVEKPQKYMPYPIIFVSGIRTTETSPSMTWPKTKVFEEFRKYFLTDPESLIPKYEYQNTESNELKPNEKPHLEFFFYDSKEAPVDINANMLKNEIEKILSNNGGYYDTNANIYVDPCPTPKVIIVAHSYGGIITRYMLANNIGNIRDKVAAVFFLGAPQLGSPMAAVGYFLPKEIPYLMEDIRDIDDTLRKEDFNDRIWDEINFKILRNYERQKVIGNLKFIKWAESEGGLYTSVRDIFDNAAIENAVTSDHQLLALYREIPPVYQKGVVWATLIPDDQANTYRKKFELYNPADPNKPFVRYIPRNGDLSYDLSKAVLSTLGTDIGIEKVHAIAGQDNLQRIREYLYWKASVYMSGQFDRLDYSCIKNNLWSDGDGVVNLASQKTIPGAESPNTHVINSAHIGNWGLIITGELDHPDTPNIILQAIDDKPVIEDVRFWEGREWLDPPEPDYAIVKVKDYLLADIDIVEMTVGGSPVDLSEFRDPGTGAYKPYVKFKKDFLKERDYIEGSRKFHLMPGEFVVKINKLAPLTNRKIYVKVKNPAKKQTSCALYFRSAGSIATAKYGAAAEITGPVDWPNLREAAYSNFLNSQPFDYDDNTKYINGIPLRVLGIPELGNFDIIGGSLYGGHTTWAYGFLESMVFKHKANFRLDITDKKIKSIEFTGGLRPGLYSPYPGDILDFDVLVYGPTNQLLFSLSTATDSVFKKELNPKSINLNGDNFWEFRPSFSEYNCIPLENYYFREAYVDAGIFVTFEEEDAQ